jgi:hypothetical protein
MDLDWCNDAELKTTTPFNDESIIVSKYKIVEEKKEQPVEKKKDNINVDDCFNIKTECTNGDELLNVLYYLSGVSNHLRNLIRSRCIKSIEAPNPITEEEFNKIINFLTWLKNSSTSIKDHFSPPLRKDNSYDPNSIKPFKTSSYKFCNYNESCLVHKNKNKICDKNHFVFEMIINDITKLINSINIIGIDNLNWILSNKLIYIDYDEDTKKYSIQKITSLNNIEHPEHQFHIDKNLICKSFDVVSFVLNKMYDEANSFLSTNIQSLQINI